jgi:hypothetical protein
MKRLSGIITIPMVLLFVAVVGHADPITYNGEVNDTPFTHGDGIQGSTDSHNFYNPASWEYYYFCGNTGDEVVIEVHRTTSAMDPAMLVCIGATDDSTGIDWFSKSCGPDMTYKAHGDDEIGIPHGVGGIFKDPRVQTILPSTGVYTLAVFDYFGAGISPEFEIHASGIAGCVNETEVTEVEIDIKPGSDPNSINPESKGIIPVAILTTDDFDATTVDPLSVQFGPEDGATEVHEKGHIEDVDEDGDPDLVLHFITQETGIVCEDVEARLTGETFDGQAIEGFDSVNIVDSVNIEKCN